MKLIGMLLAGVLALFGATVATAEPGPNVKGWDFSQTRSAGHYAVVGTALHIWTDDATSLAKVAGYRGANLPLADVDSGAEPSIDWQGTSPAPGLQLVINAAGKDRILVGEGVYGGAWWMSDSGCDTWCDTLTGITWLGGGGSPHSAPLSAWSAALPDVTVKQIGFSLGSGVKGDGTLRSLTIAGDVYTFEAFVPPTKTSVSIPGTVPDSSTTPPTTTTTVTTTIPRPTESSAPPERTEDSTVEQVQGGSTPAGDIETAAPERLAETGASRVGAIVLVGLVLLGGGITGVIFARKRSRR